MARSASNAKTARRITPVGTTTTGFVGPTRYGPVVQTPDLLTSLADFERVYGGGNRLRFRNAAGAETGESDHFLWHAARAFFTEGGTRLYITRIFRPLPDSGGAEQSYTPRYNDPSHAPFNHGSAEDPLWDDGHGRAQIGSLLKFRSRFPGEAGNLVVRLRIQAGQNILRASRDPARSTPTQPVYRSRIGAVTHGDVVWIQRARGLPAASYFRVERDSVAKGWRFRDASSSTSAGRTVEELGLVVSPQRGKGDAIRVLTVSVQVQSNDRAQDLGTWADLTLDPDHRHNGSPDSIFARFEANPSSLSEELSPPLFMDSPPVGTTEVEILEALQTQWLASHPESTAADWLDGLKRGNDLELTLKGGNDGQRPSPVEYEGRANPAAGFKTGLHQWEDVEDLSIVAAPGSTAKYDSESDRRQVIDTLNLLIRHAERMRYRIAALDSPPAQGLAEIQEFRARFDSKHAALYYPWVTVLDPVSQQKLNLPPSGFVVGIYARNDIERAVWKAPANEVVALAIGFEQMLNKSQQELLNPLGINCFRFFEGRGFRLWGARTISSDPEWKYVNLRRYFNYLERSIDRGTQWTVFEPNGETLWGNVRRTIEDFLLNEWQSGALLGDKPEKAFFVKCDRSTMNQNDLDQGRLICEIGVAPLRPAEFVIFRIGQWTADRKG